MSLSITDYSNAEVGQLSKKSFAVDEGRAMEIVSELNNKILLVGLPFF